MSKHECTSRKEQGKDMKITDQEIYKYNFFKNRFNNIAHRPFPVTAHCLEVHQTRKSFED